MQKSLTFGEIAQIPKGYVGSILIADRYIIASYCSAKFRYRPREEKSYLFGEEHNLQRGGTVIWLGKIRYVGKNTSDPMRRIYYDDYSRTTLEHNLREALLALKEAQPSISSITIGCCLGLESTLSADRKHDRDRYGRIVSNDLHPEWGEFDTKPGVNLYEIACGIFPDISNEIYVRSDVSLAAMSEYYTRIQPHQSLHHVATEEHYRKFEASENAPGRAEYGRHITLAYVKLSAEINAGVVYNGELLGGMNHPFMNAMRPRRFELLREVETEEGEIEEQELVDLMSGCPRHGGCYSGLISERVLVERLGLPFEGERVMSRIDIAQDHWLWDLIAHYVAELCITIMASHMPTTIVFGGRLVADDDPVWPRNDILSRADRIIYEYLSADGKRGYPDPDLLRLGLVESLNGKNGVFTYLQREIHRHSAPRGGTIFSAKSLCRHTDEMIRIPKDEIL